MGVRAGRSFVRTLSDRVREDRSLSADIERVAEAIRDGRVLAAVEAELAGKLP
jgi:histidine ammonia-lyase